MPRNLSYTLNIPPAEALRRVRQFAAIGPSSGIEQAMLGGGDPKAIYVESDGDTFTSSTWRGTGKYYDPGADRLHGSMEPTRDGCVVRASVPHRLGRKVGVGVVAFFLSFILSWVLLVVSFFLVPALGIPIASLPNAVAAVPLLLYLVVLVTGLKLDSRCNTEGEKALIAHLDKAFDGCTISREETSIRPRTLTSP